MVAKGRNSVSLVKAPGNRWVDASGGDTKSFRDLICQADAVFPVDPQQRSTMRENLGTRPVLQHVFDDLLND